MITTYYPGVRTKPGTKQVPPHNNTIKNNTRQYNTNTNQYTTLHYTTLHYTTLHYKNTVGINTHPAQQSV